MNAITNFIRENFSNGEEILFFTFSRKQMGKSRNVKEVSGYMTVTTPKFIKYYYTDGDARGTISGLYSEKTFRIVNGCLVHIARDLTQMMFKVFSYNISIYCLKSNRDAAQAIIDRLNDPNTAFPALAKEVGFFPL